MDVGVGSVVGYFSPGRVFPRSRLRENPWPVRNRNWLANLFPGSTTNRRQVILTAYWYENYNPGDAEWGFAMETVSQVLNSPSGPVLNGSAFAVRCLSTGGVPGSNLKAYCGKYPTQSIGVLPTVTVSGNDILVNFSSAQITSLLDQFGPGRMYCEVWDNAWPVPVSVFEFYAGPSLKSGG